MGRLGLHGLVRSFVGMGAGSVARHCAHELIFVWAPIWLQIGTINFTCAAKAVAGALDSPCDAVSQGNAPCQACRFHTRCDHAGNFGRRNLMIEGAHKIVANDPARQRGGFKEKRGYLARRTFPCTPSKAPSTSSQ